MEPTDLSLANASEMHALDQVARATGQPRFNLWARELAHAAHAAFTTGPRGRGPRRMVWKMSTDLSRVLVPSMGHHDPLDGFITCLELQHTAALLANGLSGPGLGDAAADFAALVEGGRWATADPLGLGGLLMDAFRVEQLSGRKELAHSDLLVTLLAAAFEGLSHYAQLAELGRPASRRLAFRELGLAIGLHAVELMTRSPRARGTAVEPELLKALAPYGELGLGIEAFWLDPAQRKDAGWSEHLDINEVMLATCLVPEGFLVLETG